MLSEAIHELHEHFIFYHGFVDPSKQDNFFPSSASTEHTNTQNSSGSTFTNSSIPSAVIEHYITNKDEQTSSTNLSFDIGTTLPIMDYVSTIVASHPTASNISIPSTTLPRAPQTDSINGLQQDIGRTLPIMEDISELPATASPFSALKSSILSTSLPTAATTDSNIDLHHESFSSTASFDKSKIPKSLINTTYETHQNSILLNNNMTSKQKLLNDPWLNDADIYNFMIKLKILFPDIKGMENPILLSHQPDVIEKTRDFNRILLSRSNHWV